MRIVRVLVVALSVTALVYGLPVAIEIEMARRHVNPWLVCVLLADLPACAVLFALRLCSTALAIYALTAAVDCVALLAGIGPENSLIMAANFAPSVLVAVVLFRIALRSSVLHEEA